MEVFWLLDLKCAYQFTLFLCITPCETPLFLQFPPGKLSLWKSFEPSIQPVCIADANILPGFSQVVVSILRDRRKTGKHWGKAIEPFLLLSF